MEEEFQRKLARIDSELEDLYKSRQLLEAQIRVLNDSLNRLRTERVETCLKLQEFQR